MSVLPAMVVDVENGFARLMAELFGLPRWSPGAIRRAAGVVLVVAVVWWPATFEAGVAIWSDHLTEMLIDRMQPLLAELGSDGTSSGIGGMR